MANLIGTYTLFKRETRRFMKVYMQTILSPMISNLLYLAIFGVSLHRAIPTISGITFLEFLAPGLIMMGIINNAFQNPSSSLIISKYQGLIADLLIIPLSRVEIMLAFTFSAILRGLVVGAATFVVIIFFVNLTFPSIAVSIMAVLLAATFFSFLGIFVGIWADEFDKTAIIQNFILTPLTFLGGVFYPIASLPETMRLLSLFNPIVYMVDLLRYGLTGVHEFPIIVSLGILTMLTLISGLITSYILKTGWRLQN